MAEVLERQGRQEAPERRRSHPRTPDPGPESASPQEPAEATAQESREASAQERSEEAPQEPEKDGSWISRIGFSAVGWGLVLLVLAGYFVWLASQMGSAAVTGVGPLVAVFAAAIVGVLLAGAALLLASRYREH